MASCWISGTDIMEPIRLPRDLDRLRGLLEARYGRRPVLLRTLNAVLDDIAEDFGEPGTYRHTAERVDRELGPALTAALDVEVGAASPEEEAVAHVLAEWCRIGPTLE